jgi:hypothetical protein
MCCPSGCRCCPWPWTTPYQPGWAVGGWRRPYCSRCVRDGIMGTSHRLCHQLPRCKRQLNTIGPGNTGPVLPVAWSGMSTRIAIAATQINKLACATRRVAWSVAAGYPFMPYSGRAQKLPPSACSHKVLPAGGHLCGKSFRNTWYPAVLGTLCNTCDAAAACLLTWQTHPCMPSVATSAPTTSCPQPSSSLSLGVEFPPSTFLIAIGQHPLQPTVWRCLLRAGHLSPQGWALGGPLNLAVGAAG